MKHRRVSLPAGPPNPAVVALLTQNRNVGLWFSVALACLFFGMLVLAVTT